MKKNDHQILYTPGGFVIRVPSQNANTSIRWDTVDTIVFEPHSAKTPGTHHWQRYILFLTAPPETFLDEDARWFNRVAERFFPQGGRGNTRIHITDEAPDFDTFRRQAADALNFPYTPQPGIHDEKHWNFSAQQATTTDGGHRTTSVWAQPGAASMASLYEVVYDRRGRTIEEIYEQHGSI